MTYSDGVTPGVSTPTTPTGGDRQCDGTGNTTYTYDVSGGLSTTPRGVARCVKYGYDLASNLTSLTYPGHTVTRGYDADGRMTAVKDWLGNTTTFAYDDRLQPATQTEPNGVVTTSTYGGDDRLSGIDHGVGGPPTCSRSATRGTPRQCHRTELDDLRLRRGAAAHQLDLDGGNVGPTTRRTSSPRPVRTYGYDRAGELSSGPFPRARPLTATTPKGSVLRSRHRGAQSLPTREPGR